MHKLFLRYQRWISELYATKRDLAKISPASHEQRDRRIGVASDGDPAGKARRMTASRNGDQRLPIHATFCKKKHPSAVPLIFDLFAVLLRILRPAPTDQSSGSSKIYFFFLKIQKFDTIKYLRGDTVCSLSSVSEPSVGAAGSLVARHVAGMITCLSGRCELVLSERYSALVLCLCVVIFLTIRCSFIEMLTKKNVIGPNACISFNSSKKKLFDS